MKILISGLQPDFDVVALRERLSHFGPVNDIQVVRDGDPTTPWVVVDLGLDAAACNEVARRIEGLWFKSRFLHARVLPHG